MANSIRRAVKPIAILDSPRGVRVVLQKKILAARQVTARARRDGHADASGFVPFFREVHGLPFRGHLIEW